MSSRQHQAKGQVPEDSQPRVTRQPSETPNVHRAQEKLSRDSDLYEWLLHQASELRAHQPAFLDWRELAQELDEIVALAKSESVSRLRTVLAHLLKWKYQTARRDQNSWRTTIVRERLELSLLLESKNLRNYLKDTGHELAYRQARALAGAEMRLERNAWPELFPEACEWDLNAVLNDEFFPAPASNGHSR